MKFKYVLVLLCMLPFITGCNDEDDINAIFCSGTWTLLNFYETSNWNDQTPKNTRVLYAPETPQAQEIKDFTILFKQDGSFTASANGGNLSGKWSADGKKRYITISYDSQPTGSAMAKLYFETLKKVKYYKGTDAFIQLAPEGKNTFIQFNHRK